MKGYTYKYVDIGSSDLYSTGPVNGSTWVNGPKYSVRKYVRDPPAYIAPDYIPPQQNNDFDWKFWGDQLDFIIVPICFVLLAVIYTVKGLWWCTKKIGSGIAWLCGY